MTGVITLEDRILAILLSSPYPLTAREVWDRLGRVGTESSVGCRLSTLHRDGFVYRARAGQSEVDAPTFWDACILSESSKAALKLAAK